MAETAEIVEIKKGDFAYYCGDIKGEVLAIEQTDRPSGPRAMLQLHPLTGTRWFPVSMLKKIDTI